jgi:FkbM family methyltransferase
MKSLIKRLLAHTPYRIVRGHQSNRFQEIEGCLVSLRGRGFDPRVVIDGGAHLGTFSLAARKIYPGARFHLFEPQSACLPALRQLSAREGFTLHECALGDAEGSVLLHKSDAPSTGAYVTTAVGDSEAVRAATLDATLSATLGREDRALLKLDLQGYELHALRGAKVALGSIEVILTEVSFFAQAYEPPILELMTFLGSHHFVLYDVAALAARSRDNRLHQGDLVFVRNDSELLRDKGWS